MPEHGFCKECGEKWVLDKVRTTALDYYFICPNGHERSERTALNKGLHTIAVGVGAFFLAKRAKETYKDIVEYDDSEEKRL